MNKHEIKLAEWTYGFRIRNFIKRFKVENKGLTDKDVLTTHRPLFNVWIAEKRIARIKRYQALLAKKKRHRLIK